MTTRDAYILGWIYGRLDAELAYDKSGNKTTLAAMRPYSGMAEIINAAYRQGVLKGELNKVIGSAAAQVEQVEAETDGDAEKVQPLEVQGSWQFGYFAGCAKRQLVLPEDYNITEHRKRARMSQAELAAKMGTDQSKVSRWERGQQRPTKDELAKLREILD